MKTYRTIDVFTPSKPASLSFVERGQLERQLSNALVTPGKQVVIFGHSGPGKTTLNTNALAKEKILSVTCRCTQDSTFESVVLSAFDKLNMFYTSEHIATHETKITSQLESDYKVVKASVEGSLSAGRSDTTIRALPPQLTAERLAEFCGAAGCCWVLEDFHKVPQIEKIKLAQSMKVFMDTAAEYETVRVIAIGAVDTAREVVECDPEMRNRVAEIAVPLLSVEELKEILAKGEKLLNVKFGALKNEIANYSSGLGAVCHQLALNICLAAGIRETVQQEFWINTDQLQEALQQYVRDTSDTLKSAFDKAIKRKRERKFDNTNLILEALTLAGAKGATHAELLSTIQKKLDSYPAGNLTTYLRELEDADRGEILRHDSTSGKYYFKDPVFLVYAQCLYVPARGSKVVTMHLLGVDFKIDLNEFQDLRQAIEANEIVG